MNAVIRPGTLRGSVRVPASKSAAHRALIAAALADGLTTIHINALNDDIEATAECLMDLGALIDYFERRGIMAVRPIESAPNLARAVMGVEGKAASHVDLRAGVELDCGESGSTLRFLLPVACALGVNTRFIGHGRLPERPNAILVDALRAHGAVIDSDRLPLNASGSLAGGLWELPGDVSSQYVTGLMFALPLLPRDSEIRLTTRLESAAYVDMTVDMLDRFGVAVEPTGSGWRVPGNQVYRSPEALAVEGDWSAAAFWLAANAMGSDIDVDGLSYRTTQGDRAVTDLLGQPVIDASGVPDLVPALAAAAATMPRRTVITGAARLRLKESDRLESTAGMIRALGGRVEVREDGLAIDGGAPLNGGTVDGANDHRIVMAAAILATRAGGPVTITGAEAVGKSYPDFFRDFEKLGGNVHVEQPGR